MSRRRKGKSLGLAYWLILAFSLVFAAIIAATPLFGLEDFGMGVFAGFCHQQPERSYFWDGRQLPVCARCLGVYAGLLLGALVYPLASKGSAPPGWVLLAATAPMALDGGTQLLGLRESDNILRLATGSLFGLALPYYLIPALEAVLGGFAFKYGRR